jgi:hypothetical protein
VGFLTSAQEFGNGFKDGFEKRQAYHANKNNAPINTAQDTLDNHIKELVVDKGKRGFGVNTDTARRDIGQMLDNPNFMHDVQFDTRINKYQVQADEQLAEIGRDVINKLQAGVPAQQFSTADLGLAKGFNENVKIADRQQRKNDIVFGLHPNGIKNPQDLEDIRFRSDYQRINMEDKDLFNRAEVVVDLVNRGEIEAKDLDNADLTRAALFMRQRDAKDNARLFRRRELTPEKIDNMDPKTAKATFERIDADNSSMNELGMQMWNANNPNDQVDLQEFSSRRVANEDEGRRMAGNRMVGAGEFGFVFEGNQPGVLIKQEAPVSVAWNTGAGPGTGLNEIANLADMQGVPGVPKMLDAQQLNDGTTRIAMEDLRDNYENYRDVFGNSGRDQATDIKRAQQQGGMNLRGFDLADRHEGNVMVHALTGRPMQVDFGIGSQLNNNRSKAIALANNTFDGFKAAGLDDEADILYGLVADLVNDGKENDAYKMAKTGFAQLQKIKRPINAPTAAQALAAQAPPLTKTGRRRPQVVRGSRW